VSNCLRNVDFAGTIHTHFPKNWSSIMSARELVMHEHSSSSSRCGGYSSLAAMTKRWPRVIFMS